MFESEVDGLSDEEGGSMDFELRLTLRKELYPRKNTKGIESVFDNDVVPSFPVYGMKDVLIN